MMQIRVETRISRVFQHHPGNSTSKRIPRERYRVSIEGACLRSPERLRETSSSRELVDSSLASLGAFHLRATAVLPDYHGNSIISPFVRRPGEDTTRRTSRLSWRRDGDGEYSGLRESNGSSACPERKSSRVRNPRWRARPSCTRLHVPTILT